MERISRFRAILLLILFCSILALFAVKLFDLQIIETNGNTDNIAKYTTVTTVRAARGDILDRNGNVLVGNRYRVLRPDQRGAVLPCAEMPGAESQL